jgi:nickel-dependent lactate racemase
MSESIRITIPYGQDTRSFDVPTANLGDVLHPNQVSVSDDGDSIIAQAIANPIGTPSLEKVLQGKRDVVIIVDDLTRPTPVDRIVPLLLDRLNIAGIANDQIKIIIALGTHRPMREDEIRKRFGVDIVRRVRILNSHFADKSELIDCGVAEDGTHLWVDRQVMASDIRIGVGTILPHPTAGWGGGAKIIYPGVGGADTVSHFHLQQTKFTRNYFGDITSPIRSAMESWVGQLGLHFIVNVICTPEGKIYKAVSGHFVEAHRKGVEYAQEVFAVRVKHKADVVVAGSYPADLDFWQALKALMSADLLVKDGGTIILVTPCPEGIGPHSEFAKYVGDDEPDALAVRAFAGEFADPYVVAGGVTLGRMRKRTRFAIVSSGLNATVCQQMKMQHFAATQQAIDWALASHGENARLSVIPYGAEIFPLITETS